ncbi:MAG: methyltransferase [Enterovirga sp.]|nr:methyltransferase [Enterovirga sp.]
MAEVDEDLSEDRLLGGSVALLQPRRGHRAGTDAVLLAAFASLRGGELAVDLGAGTGAVGLMIARRCPEARLLLVEREPDLTVLCRRNIALNGLGDRAHAVVADVFAPKAERRAAGLTPGLADLVATNPPFFESGEARRSPEPRRASAHLMAGGGLAEWLEAAADILRPKGRLAMIYRADGLGRCLEAMGRRFGSVTVGPVYPKAGDPASRVLIGAVKDGHARLQIDPPLVLHGPDGRFTEQAESLHRLADMKRAPEGALDVTNAPSRPAGVPRATA